MHINLGKLSYLLNNKKNFIFSIGSFVINSPETSPIKLHPVRDSRFTENAEPTEKGVVTLKTPRNPRNSKQLNPTHHWYMKISVIKTPWTKDLKHRCSNNELWFLLTTKIDWEEIIVGTREHQNIRIGILKCLIHICPDDPSIVQGFCEM